MNHLAATMAAVSDGKASVAAWTGSQPVGSFRDVNLPRRRADLVFLSCRANFLEIYRGRFHYSVIDRSASIALAAGRAGSHLFNDEVPALISSGAAAGADAQAGDE
jgi:hypothetical protein